MSGAYPGELARIRCAARTREELAEITFKPDPSEREARRLAWMAERCSGCGACPLTVRALRVMSPARPQPAATVMEFRLAG